MREINYHKKRSIKKVLVGIFLGILALSALILFGLFRVREVTVTGNSRYSAQEIQDAVMQDGLCKNTLYLLWKYSDPDKAEQELPFLNGLEVTMLSPYQVQIRVYEKAEVGYFQKSGSYIYFDEQGQVIEQSKKKHEDVPKITGITLDKVTLYETIPVKDETQKDSLITLTRLLNKNSLIPDEIKFDKTEGIFLYFGQVRVKLGEAVSLEEKTAALHSIIPQLENEEGTVHMENYSPETETVTFKKGETEQQVEVNQDGQAQTDGQQESQSEGESSGQSESETETESEPVYDESDGTFSTDAQGNEVYTDAAGNTTTNTDQYNYTDENGGIITDGYGYIDPYTGAYILK